MAITSSSRSARRDTTILSFASFWYEVPEALDSGIVDPSGVPTPTANRRTPFRIASRVAAPGSPSRLSPSVTSTSALDVSSVGSKSVVDTSTASAVGENDWTTNSNRRPITGIDTTSPRVTTRPPRAWARYSSPPIMRIGSVGASVAFAAGFVVTARTPTFSSSPIWAFRRCRPSRRIAPRFASSGSPRSTIAAVFFRPSTITASPSCRWSGPMSSGSIRTTPRPTSADLASRTLRNLSSSRMASSHTLLERHSKNEGGGRPYWTFTLTDFGAGAGSRFGRWISRTPLFRVAATFSGSTCAGRGRVRWNPLYVRSR